MSVITRMRALRHGGKESRPGQLPFKKQAYQTDLAGERVKILLPTGSRGG